MTKTRVRYLDLDVAAMFAYTEDYGTLADRLGVSRRTLHRLASTGLSIDQADTFASALGAHPCELWPSWPTPSQPVRCSACQHCSRQIVQPIRKGARLRRTCSTRCRDAMSRALHLEERRAAERDRWAANQTEERRRARAQNERARRARRVA